MCVCDIVLVRVPVALVNRLVLFMQGCDRVLRGVNACDALDCVIRVSVWSDGMEGERW